jgi:O-antigen/teichoic acid export membrane protein
VTSGRIEILFLGAVASGEQIAQYTVAVMLVTSAVTLPASLAGAAMPAVAAASGAGEHQRAEDAVVRALRVSALLSLPLTAVIVATGPAFIVALYGADFREAGELSRYMALGALVIPCGRLATTYWSGLGQMRPPFTAGVLGATLELLLAFLLIPGLAARGAVAATLVGQCTTALIVVGLTRRALARRIVPARSWCSAAVASALGGWAGVAAASGGGLVGAVAGGVATAAVFVAVVLVLRQAGAPLLTAEDGRWLRGALPARLGALVGPLAAAA